MADKFNSGGEHPPNKANSIGPDSQDAGLGGAIKGTGNNPNDDFPPSKTL